MVDPVIDFGVISLYSKYQTFIASRAITGYGFSLGDMVKLSIQDIAISTVTITSQD